MALAAGVEEVDFVTEKYQFMGSRWKLWAPTVDTSTGDMPRFDKLVANTIGNLASRQRFLA